MAAKDKNAELTREERIEIFLAEHVWPKIPDEIRGKPISKDECEEILGFGPEGY